MSHRQVVFFLLAASFVALPSCRGCRDDDDDDAPAGSNGSLVFVGQPSNAAVSAVITPPITVEIRDTANVLIPTATNTVTLAFQNNPGAATLGGTVSVAAVAGVATFNDITVSAAGTGYTLNASATGFTSGISNAFDVTSGPGPATQVAITTQPPATRAPYEAFNVVVELRDASNNVDTSFTGPVTIAINANPGNLLYHASGLGTIVHEIIDLNGPTVLPAMTTSYSPGEIHSMVYDPAVGLIRSADLNGEFCLIDPGSGDIVPYTNAATLGTTIKGMAFNGMGQIRAVDAFSDDTFTIDLGTGVESALGNLLTLSGSTVSGATGLARHPSTGVFYAILKATGFTGRPLVTVNMGTGVCTLVGDTGEFVAAITFTPDGTLWAVTGDGSTTPETLFTVNTTTGVLTSALTLGNGTDGESIVYFPRRLGGTLTVNAVAGVATFNNLHIDQPGTGYTLQITSGALTPATTSAIDITGSVTPTATVEFSATTSNVAENVGGGTATITLQLSAAQTHNLPVMIYIDTTSTATGGGSDHSQPLAFQVTIPAGQTTFNFTVPIVDDAVVEANETVILTIGAAQLSTGFGANTTHTLTITNDD